ncbi:MAG: peptidylprolyl isomerase [Spongiibacteraceae bacterium]
MSTSSSLLAVSESSQQKSRAVQHELSQPPSSLRNLWREPLLHFLLLGGLLFAVDHVLVSRRDDPHTIVVGPEVDREAIELFTKERQREPNEEELKALHRVWLDNEVLYREGLALEVDRGDQAIRDRVIFKTLSVIDAGVKLPPIDDKTLREWFEQHRDKYDDPARYSFQEAVLANNPMLGDGAEMAVREFVAALNNGASPETQAGLRVFKDRPQTNLEQSYGVDFRKAIDELTPGSWHAVKARDGWHAVRIDTITPARPAVFEILRGVVLQDWKDATAAELRTASVRELEKKYRVIFASQPQ